MLWRPLRSFRSTDERRSRSERAIKTLQKRYCPPSFHTSVFLTHTAAHVRLSGPLIVVVRVLVLVVDVVLLVVVVVVELDVRFHLQWRKFLCDRLQIKLR